MSNRNAKCIVVAGARGTGKTTFIKEMLKGCKSNAIVCTPHVYEWDFLDDTDLKTFRELKFAGAKRHIIKPKYTLERLKFLVNGHVFFDDCRNFLPFNPNSKEGVDFIQFLIDGRHKAVDFIVVAHGFTQISPCFYPYIDDIILFRTTDNLQLAKNKILYFDELKALQTRVNAKAKKEPHYCEHIKFT